MTDWDRRFLGHASIVAQWSKDPSTKVGAVITRDDRTIVSQGYNGFPRGCSDDKSVYEDREKKYQRIVHAEANAIVTAHQDLRGCTLYTWPFMPCPQCAGLAIQAGIRRIVSVRNDNPRWSQPFACTEIMLGEARVKLDILPSEEGAYALSR